MTGGLIALLLVGVVAQQAEAPLSCAVAATSAPPRETLVDLSDQNDARLQEMVVRLRQIAERDVPDEAAVRAVVEGVQADTDAFASAFEAGMCAYYVPEVTPAAEAMVRQLGNNIRGAPGRMRDTALRGTALDDRPTGGSTAE